MQRVRKRFDLSTNAMLGLGAGAIVLLALLFVAFLDVALAAWPRLMQQPHQHEA